MPAVFEPLLKSDREAGAYLDPAEDESKLVQEGFVSESETNNILSSVFLGIGMMLLGLAIFWVFFWAYSLDKNVFIMSFAVLVVLYSALMTALVILQRSKMTGGLFKFYLGSAIFMDCVATIVVIFFAIKWFKNPVGKLGLELPVEEYLRGQRPGRPL